MPDLLDIKNVVKDVDKQKAIDKAAVLADARLSKQIHDCRVYVFKIWSEQCCKFLISLVKILSIAFPIIVCCDKAFNDGFNPIKELISILKNCNQFEVAMPICITICFIVGCKTFLKLKDKS